MKKKFHGLLAMIVAIVFSACVVGCGQKTHAVELTQGGDTPMKLIKAVQEVADLSVKDAKEIVDNVPSVVVENVTEEEALAIKSILEEAGGIVTIR